MSVNVVSLFAGIGGFDLILAKVAARYKINLKAIEKAVTAELGSVAVPTSKAKKGRAK